MLGTAALLGPWAAHLGCGSSSFHYLARCCQPARPCTKGPQSRRGRRIPLHAGDETDAPLGRSGTSTEYTREAGLSSANSKKQKFCSEIRNWSAPSLLPTRERRRLTESLLLALTRLERARNE